MSEEMPNHLEQPHPHDTFAYDVFVSYSAVDAPWVQLTLVPQLHAAHVRVITSDVFELGAPQASEFERAVLSSGKTLLVLTPAALADAWAEFAAILVHSLDPASRERRFIPIIKEPCNLPLRFQGLVTFDATGVADWERLRTAVQAPLPEPPSPAIPVLSIPAPTPLPPGSRMPLSHNPLFVGREDELRELARTLKAGDTAAIGQIAAATGLGGIGKTQLAAEFVHRYGQYFAGGVFWLSFADSAAVPAEVSACGGLAGMRLHPDFSALSLDDQVQLVLAEWHKPIPQLLVFDNCEDEALLDEWRPKHGGCRVLLTSRRAEWDAALGVHAVPLAVLPRPQSIALLRAFRPDLANDDADLDAIAAELGDLPLALHLAGSFLKLYQRDMTTAEYLDELRTATGIAHESLEGVGISPTKHDLSVARTFQLSYDRLDVTVPFDALALNILMRAAYFAPGEPILRDLLRATLELAPDERQAKRQVVYGIRRLVSLGLVEEEAEGSVRVHRLVAAFVRAVAPNATAQIAVEETMLDVVGELNAQGYPAPLLALQPHLRAITNAALERQDERAAHLGNSLGYHLHMIGAYRDAQRSYEQAIVIYRRVLGPDHPNTANSFNSLGGVLQAQGQYGEALHYFKQVLTIYQRALGPDHPDTATSLHNVGTVLGSLGQYAEAQRYFEQALAILERVLGPDHPDTAHSLNNLGVVLQNQEQYAEAQRYFEQALAIRWRVLGPDHPATAGSLNSLGVVFSSQGQYGEAQRCFEQVLAIYQRVLGPDHPATAGSLNNLGALLQNQEQYAEAQRYFEQALAIRWRVLGPDHPDTATSLNNLGMALQNQGQYAEAQDYLEQGLAIYQRALGPDHPDTQVVRHKLARLRDQ